MKDTNDRGTSCLGLSDQGQDGLPIAGIKARRGFVQQKRGIGINEPTRDVHPLLLTARKRGRAQQPQRLWNIQPFQQVLSRNSRIFGVCARGAEWFRGTGTPRSPGTKVFALSGNLAQTGLIEVPMGIPLRTIVEDMGGGVPDGRTFKAAQTGGPSGGCVPHRHLDTPVDYESLRELGSIMGSGGLVVMDDSVAMPELARYFMQFCMAESCGKCVPCRAGTVQLHALLDGICEGTADADDLALLEELCACLLYTSPSPRD